MTRVNVKKVVAMLDILHSADDPVWVGGIETTPRGLSAPVVGRRDAMTFKVAYHSAQGSSERLTNGTLLGMLLNRLGCRYDRRSTPRLSRKASKKEKA